MATPTNGTFAPDSGGSVDLTIMSGSVSNQADLIYSERAIPSDPPVEANLDISSKTLSKLTLTLYAASPADFFTLDALRGLPGTLTCDVYTGAAMLINSPLSTAAPLGESFGSATFLLADVTTVHWRTPVITVTVGGSAVTGVMTAHTAFGTDIAVGEASFTLPSASGISLLDEVSIALSAGGTAPLPWRGFVVSVNPSFYPVGVTVVCKGYLIKAQMTEMEKPAAGHGTSPPPGGRLMAPADLSGETDIDMITNVLGFCGLADSGTMHLPTESCGRLFGTVTYTPFIWADQESGLSFIQRLDEICFFLFPPITGDWFAFRTFDGPDGTITRTHINMVPGASSPWTAFTEGIDIFDTPGQRDTLTSKNKVVVVGYDRGDGSGAVNYTISTGVPAIHISNPMIEWQSEADISPSGDDGMSCEAVANGILSQWDFPQEKYTLASPREDDIKVGDTIRIISARIGGGGYYWVQNVARSVDDSGFTLSLTVVKGG